MVLRSKPLEAIVLSLQTAVLAAALGPPYADIPDEPSLSAGYSLLGGGKMPIFGLGVFRSRPGEETYNAVKWALELGYRLVDTAMIYRNEESVGQAVRDSGIPREELYVVTKLWDADHSYDGAIRGCEESLKRLGLEYVDLYLVHSPNTGRLVEVWDALVELKTRGLVKAIGVSNYNVQHIEALVAHGRELPAVNQIEMHPLVYKDRQPLLEYCRDRGIVVQAYGSIFSSDPTWLEHESVSAVVAAHPGKTPAQVLLRWGLQMGFQLIPKSARQHRLMENADIFNFELSATQMDALSGMEGTLGQYWNPLDKEVDVGDVGRGSEL